ncbi:MAG: MBL fold metallo-hydrolase [Candidatus Bathyarchaeia archaeon]
MSPLRIKWESGVSIECGGNKIVFDPQSKIINSKASFVTHAHADHSYSFRLRHMPVFSSEETMRLVSVEGVRASRWQPLAINRGVKIDDIEVVPHVSGHILGSYEFEVRTPEGVALFTGDLNTRERRLIEPAEAVRCDVLIIEATYGSPEFIFPPDDVITEEMTKWASKILSENKIPVFQADAIGNAQEIIRIFNENTSVPIISHWRVSRVNEVYGYYGRKVEYIDINSEEASKLLSSANAIIVAPKMLSLSLNNRFIQAMVSGWAVKFRRQSFPLSDHADFPSLLDFIRNCSPKLVLTYHGGVHNEILAKYIEKKMGVRSYPIDLISTNFTT